MFLLLFLSFFFFKNRVNVWLLFIIDFFKTKKFTSTINLSIIKFEGTIYEGKLTIHAYVTKQSLFSNIVPCFIEHP